MPFLREHPFLVNYGVNLNRKMLGENIQVITYGIKIVDFAFQLITSRKVETPGGFISRFSLCFNDQKMPTAFLNPVFNMLQ